MRHAENMTPAFATTGSARSRGLYLAVWLAAAMFLRSGAMGHLDAQDLHAVLDAARAGGRKGLFETPSTGQVLLFSMLIENFARTGVAPTGAELEPLGFESMLLDTPLGTYLTIRERIGVRGGRGIYFFAFPSGSGGRLVLQIPHSFFDLETSVIGLRLVEGIRVAGFFVNTMHRYCLSLDGRPGYPADAASNETHFFYAATAGLARTRPELLFVQLHGFETGTRSDFDFILSDGNRNPAASGVLARAARAFRSQFGDRRVGVYEPNVAAPEANMNVEGRLLNGLAHGEQFLHVEMSPSERARLKSEPAEVSKLRAALSASVSLMEVSPAPSVPSAAANGPASSGQRPHRKRGPATPQE